MSETTETIFSIAQFEGEMPKLPCFFFVPLRLPYGNVFNECAFAR
ncbi:MULTISPECIES: hypothetical protein [unclassified Nodularia (in: cyanobacteria)]|nr:MULTISPECIES: hypothetical protein [unclassified Nodularia (in: cyanobacteria)]